MSLERDLAKRFLHEEPDREGGKRRLRPVVRISATGIALGVSLILLSIFVVRGFKSEIRGKINALVGNIRISNPENVYDQYTLPLHAPDDLKQTLLAQAQGYDTGAYLATFIQQMSLIKTDSAFRGVLMMGRQEWGRKGSGELYKDLSHYLTEGDFPQKGTTEAALSRQLASHLGLEIGDDFFAYFGQNEQLRVRKYQLSGLFETGFEDYDQNLVLLDQSSLQSVAGWNEEQVGGISVHLRDDKHTQQLFDDYFQILAQRNEQLGERYTMFTSEELNLNMFAWLDLLDANVLLILALMIAVAGMTIITGVVVLVLEKVPAIATLKALGQRDASLKKAFRLMAGHILLRGLLIGNAIALILAWVQDHWQILTLDPSQYFMSFVPIQMDLSVIVWINIIVFLLVYLFVLVPTSLIARVRPADSLRFE